jgi:hypothetical protein
MKLSKLSELSKDYIVDIRLKLGLQWTVSFSYFGRGGKLNPLAAPSNEGLFHYPFWPWGK